MDKILLTDFIKEKCQEIGFSKSGIAEVDYYESDKEKLVNWINNDFLHKKLALLQIINCSIYKYYYLFLVFWIKLLILV